MAGPWDMEGQVALVTGGAGTVGRGVCRALTAAGARTVVLDRDIARAEAATLVMACDVTDAQACAAAVDRVAAELGPVTTLVNLAQHVVVDTPALVVTADDMARSLASGPIATLRMMQLCHPHMKAAGGGAIVNAGSNSGTFGSVGRAAYAAAKEAIRGITKVAAAEWGVDGIRVNAVCPFTPEDPDAGWVQAKLAATPMRRAGDPEADVGSLVVYLATAGTFITGRTLFVDGGFGSWR
jgi:NAD(P)-dependent dehydrogenase (short-subunit alcohol dehydrogenase family)